MVQLTTKIIQAANLVHQPFVSDPDNRYHKDNRFKGLPNPAVGVEVIGGVTSEVQVKLSRDAEKYESLVVKSSKGKKHRVIVPASYASSVPKIWVRDIRKLCVTAMVAQGNPICHIVANPKVGVKARLTIYG